MPANFPAFNYPESHRHQPLEKRIFEVAPGVYSFVGYGSSNIGLIVGEDGYIVIDCGDNPEGSREIKREIAAITAKPMRALVLTHGHVDHILCGGVFMDDAPEGMPVWARSNFGAEATGLKGLEKITGLRGARQFGKNIPDGKYTANSLVPRFPASDEQPVFAAPNQFMTGEEQRLEIAGVELLFIAAPGETPDMLNIWLPGPKVLFTGDNMYRSFPNVYPVRGCAYRDPAIWARTLRKLAELKPEAIVMGHTQPACGAEGREMLDNYAEAIECLLAETKKGMDAGLGPDELAATVTLPERLRTLPYLAEYYGSIPWTVRSIFSALLGWFDGDPASLVTLMPAEEASRMAALAGGAERLLAEARGALAAGDYPWAARLSGYILRLEGKGFKAEARETRAAALEALSDMVLPMSGKNYLLACALELREAKN